MAYIFITKGKTNWKYLLIIFILGLIVGSGTLWLASRQKISPAELPETKKPEKVEDQTANWKTYRNEEIGVEFKYPIQYIEDTYKEEGAKGKEITAVFGPPGYFSFSFSAYTSDYEPPQGTRIFYGWTGTKDAVKNCPNPLEYDSEYICKIIDIAKEKGVFETILINKGNYCDLYTHVYFNNQSSSKYKGLNFELYFPDIVSEVCSYLPWNITGGRSGFDYTKLESEFYSQYYSQARNLMESKNLSEKDTEELNILYRILSTFRFL
jgi:hypothetical protein